MFIFFIDVVSFFGEYVVEIVDEVREKVLVIYFNIMVEGGDLYLWVWVEVCWWDFWYFLCCIIYGVVGNNINFMS